MAPEPIWTSALRANPLPWLLEQDRSCPGVRYLALTELLDEPANSASAGAARKAVMESGPVPEILARQTPRGDWGDHVYSGKYTGSVWSLISLWQTGADASDPRVSLACRRILDLSLSPDGIFAFAQGGTRYIHCFAGNVAAGLIALSSEHDDRVGRAVEGIARMVTGEGVPAGAEVMRRHIALRYIASATPGPGFQCTANGGLPCGWGAARVLTALAATRPVHRTPLVGRALDRTVEFLLSVDPAVADYPAKNRPSSSWQKFGFPVFYVSDYLSVLEGLVLSGRITDPRAGGAIKAMLAKQDGQGRWKREYAPSNPVGFGPGRVGQPNKWVTLRALRVVKALAA